MTLHAPLGKPINEESESATQSKKLKPKATKFQRRRLRGVIENGIQTTESAISNKWEAWTSFSKSNFKNAICISGATGDTIKKAILGRAMPEE